MHVEEIIRRCLPILFKKLLSIPQTRILDKPENLAYLSQFLNRFTDCLADYHLNEIIQEKGIKIKSELIRGTKNIDNLLHSIEEDYHQRIKLIANLLKSDDEISLDSLTPSELLTKLFILVEHADLKSLFILIDNVDGLPETDGKPDACCKLINTLIGSSNLMNLKGIYFKFFLPIEIKPLIEQLRAFNIIKPVITDWNHNKLKEVFEKRLDYAFGDNPRNPIPSLVGISEYKNIETELLEKSETPRDLILLERELLGSLNNNQIEIEKFRNRVQNFNAREKKYLSAILAVLNPIGFIIGTAFLVSFKGKIYTVTCAHLAYQASDKSKSEISLKDSTSYNKLLKYPCPTLNEIKIESSAKEDICILNTDESSSKSLEPLIIDDHDDKLQGKIGCRCFCYVESAYPRGAWLDNISVGLPVGHGFVEIYQPDCEKIRIEQGASGAPLFDSNGKILGMLGAVNPRINKAYLIPIKFIVDIIIKEINK